MLDHVCAHASPRPYSGIGAFVDAHISPPAKDLHTQLYYSNRRPPCPSSSSCSCSQPLAPPSLQTAPSLYSNASSSTTHRCDVLLSWPLRHACCVLCAARVFHFWRTLGSFEQGRLTQVTVLVRRIREASGADDKLPPAISFVIASPLLSLLPNSAYM